MKDDFGKDSIIEVERYVELVLNACPIVCLVLNEQLEAIDCNSITLKMTGARTKKELLDNYQNFYLPEQPDGSNGELKMQHYIDVAVRTGEAQTDWVFLFPDGSQMFCKVTISKVMWGETFRIFMFAEDLSEPTDDMKKVQEAENRSQLIMDNSLLITSLWNNQAQMVDCSMYALKVFGLEKKEDYINHFMDLNPEYQPDGRRTQESADYHINKAFREGYDKFDWMYFTAKREELPVETTLIRIWWNGEYHLLAHSIDKREINSTNAKLKRHSELLKVNSKIAASMMGATTKNFDEVINKQLERLGKVAGVNRTYIWRIYDKNEKLYCDQIYEWNENAEEQHGKDFTIEFEFDDAPYTKSKIMAGESINGLISLFSGDEYMIYDMQGIKSLLLLPLVLNNSVWGFIGFDDCEKENIFTQEVEQLLSSCGALIVSAISRNTTMSNLISTKNELLMQERLLRAVNESAKILLENYEVNYNETIKQALQIIGDCVDAHSVGIWENYTDEETDSLCSKRLIVWSRNEERNFSDNVSINYNKHLKLWDKDAIYRETFHISRNENNMELLSLLDSPNEPTYLMLPIVMDGKFWGFASFSFPNEGFIVSDQERTILQAANMMVANAIIREETNHELMAATGKALESVKSKNEFLARMSHEVRTPINAVMGMTTIAKNTTDKEKINDCLDTITTSSQQLLMIINDVLDMSKIDLGKMPIIKETFNFEKMISKVIAMLKEKVWEKNLTFRYEVANLKHDFIISDEKRLMQVIMNLMTNAIKFTPVGGEIVLKVDSGEDEYRNQILQISVIDNGIGIADSALPIIFNAFEQSDGSITRKYGGTGLGLAISKNIIDLMGGKIWAESDFGSGSTFSIEIPIIWSDSNIENDENKCQEHADNKEELHEYDWSNKNILLVEDVEINRNIVEALLKDTNINIHNAINGQEAIDMFNANLATYDFIFMDIQMPVMDGLTATEKIREMSAVEAKTIPIYAMTAHAFKEDKEQCLAVGMNGYITKPIDVNEMFTILAKELG